MTYKQTKFPFLLFLVIILLTMNSCSVKKMEDIDYGSKIAGVKEHPTLNIFKPKRENDSLKPVLIFVYGGNWNSGSKGTYSYVGRNFAKQDMVVVMPDYTKSPKVNYDVMTRQIANSIEWTLENIEQYGGDPDRVYLTGHSAGGHLVALATMNPQYGIDQEKIKGIILNDAAGLDMETYLKNVPPTTDQNYLTTWTNDPAQWKNASPINFINQQTPDILIYNGSKSYESILSSNKRFLEELKKVQPDATITMLKKGHVAMVSQLFWPWNDRFEEIAAFMNK